MVIFHLKRRTGGMRRCQHQRTVDELIIFLVRRLKIENVQNSSADPVVLDGVEQIIPVYDAGPCRIYKNGAGLHPSDKASVDHAYSLIGHRQMDGYDIAVLKYVLQSGLFIAGG